MSWPPRRRYTPRNVQLQRQGYRALPAQQDMHPLHAASGRIAPGCHSCQAGQPGQPNPSMEDPTRGKSQH